MLGRRATQSMVSTLGDRAAALSGERATTSRHTVNSSPLGSTRRTGSPDSRPTNRTSFTDPTDIRKPPRPKEQTDATRLSAGQPTDTQRADELLTRA
jgi:hypothetical protein